MGPIAWAQLHRAAASAASGAPAEDIAALDELLELVRTTLAAPSFHTCGGVYVTRVLASAVELLQQVLKESTDLRERVSELERRVKQAEQNRESALLGQVAYTLDTIVSSFVFGAESRPMRLGEVRKAMQRDGADEGARSRWRLVEAFAEQQGVAVGDLVACSKPLRDQCVGVAHVTPGEVERTTAAQLVQWATKSYAASVQQVLQFLRPLTLDGQPLVPRRDTHVILQGVQEAA